MSTTQFYHPTRLVGCLVYNEFPDGFEILGDGTRQIGFSIQAPDWVTASATLNVYLTFFGYEY